MDEGCLKLRDLEEMLKRGTNLGSKAMFQFHCSFFFLFHCFVLLQWTGRYLKSLSICRQVSFG